MKVTIREGYEYRPIKEDIGDRRIKESLLYESYCRALGIVEKYEDTLNFDTRKRQTKTEDERLKEKSAVKNILVLSSQRGQGKSSALYSLCEYLGDNDRNPVDKFTNPTKRYEINRKYYRLPEVIDPSSMRKDESIIKVVLSRLFNDFKRRVEDSREKIEPRCCREITDLFQSCYRCVDILDGNTRWNNIYDQESLEALSELGDSGNLKKTLKKLIDCFLDMVWRDDRTSKTLLIPIDDTDLAVGKAFDICEDIRNYLSTDNILVVMAADMDQLENAIEQKYIDQYDLMIRNIYNPKEKQVYLYKCREMATRYVEKIFPRGYRVELKKVEDAFKSEDELQLIYEDFDEKEKELFDRDFNYADQLGKALYERTGMIFIKNKDQECFFFPSTLRELNHFTRMLDEMEVIDEDRLFIYDEKNGLAEESIVEVDKIILNISVIKQYFICNWVPIHTSELIQKKIEDLATLPISKFKDSLISAIDDATKDQRSAATIPTERPLSEIIAYNSKILRKSVDYKGFADAIEILYTIILNEHFYMYLKRGTTSELTGVLGDSFKVAKYNSERFNYFSFDIDKELFEKRFITDGKVSQDIIQWMMCYCNFSDSKFENLSKRYGRSQYKDLTKKYIEARGAIDYSRIEKISVDYFGYFTKMLLYPELQSIAYTADSRGKASNIKNSVVVDVPVVEKKYNRSGIAVIRNMILNYDVHRMVCHVISDVLARNYSYEKTDFGELAYNTMANEISAGINKNVSYLVNNTGEILRISLTENIYGKDFILLNRKRREHLIKALKKNLIVSVSVYISRLEAAEDIATIKQLSTVKFLPDSYTENEPVLYSSADKAIDELTMIVVAVAEIRRCVKEMFDKIGSRSDKAVQSALKDKKKLVNQLTEIKEHLSDDKTDIG